MGSGAGAVSKKKNVNSAKVSTNTNIEGRYGIKSDKVKEIDGAFYCVLDRSEAKISEDILIAFDRYNQFSKDVDDVLFQRVKPKVKNKVSTIKF